MTETPVPTLVLTLAGPTILSMLITSIYNLADTFFVGQISTSASGAVGVVSSLMAIIQALGFMLGHGAGTIISRSLGAKTMPLPHGLHPPAFLSALSLGGLLGLGGLTFLSPFMMLLGSTETILPHACAYAVPILLAAPLMMSSLVMNNILRYEGKANLAMVGLVTGGILNILLDPVLIFGFGMGTAGAGVATALSQGVSFCILLFMFLRGKTVSRFRLGAITRSGSEFGQILLGGLPSFGRQGLNSIGGMLLNIAARSYGDAAVAGMSIVSRIFSFMLSVALGVGQGFQPVASFNYGSPQIPPCASCLSVYDPSQLLPDVGADPAVLVQCRSADPLVPRRPRCNSGGAARFPLSMSCNVFTACDGCFQYAVSEHRKSRPCHLFILLPAGHLLPAVDPASAAGLGAWGH